LVPTLAIFKAAKLYIVSLESTSNSPNQPAQPQTSNDKPVALRRFAFLSAKLNLEKEVKFQSIQAMRTPLLAN